MDLDREKGIEDMKIITSENTEAIRILINEFIVTYKLNSKENIPIDFLKYLRETGLKIEDSRLFNELCDIIEQKF